MTEDDLREYEKEFQESNRLSVVAFLILFAFWAAVVYLVLRGFS